MNPKGIADGVLTLAVCIGIGVLIKLIADIVDKIEERWRNEEVQDGKSDKEHENV